MYNVKKRKMSEKNKYVIYLKENRKYHFNWQ